MANQSSSALASLSLLIQESSLRSHIILEALIADGGISEKGLLELTFYLDTAWIVAGRTMKTHPKALRQARDCLKSWLSTGRGCLTQEMPAILCAGLQVADSIWRKTPGSLLLDATISLRNSMASLNGTDAQAN